MRSLLRLHLITLRLRCWLRYAVILRLLLFLHTVYHTPHHRLPYVTFLRLRLFGSFAFLPTFGCAVLRSFGSLRFSLVIDSVTFLVYIRVLVAPSPDAYYVRVIPHHVAVYLRRVLHLPFAMSIRSFGHILLCF